MSDARSSASGDPERSEGGQGRQRFQWLRRVCRGVLGQPSQMDPPPARLVLWAALAAGVAGVAVAALGVLAGQLLPALAGTALGAFLLGFSAALSSVSGQPETEWAQRVYPGLRSLRVAVLLVVGLFALAITASTVGLDAAGGRWVARATGWSALVVSFGALGYTSAMSRDAGGRHRPDWVFVAIAALMTGFTLWQLHERLALIFFAQ